MKYNSKIKGLTGNYVSQSKFLGFWKYALYTLMNTAIDKIADKLKDYGALSAAVDAATRSRLRN